MTVSGIDADHSTQFPKKIPMGSLYKELLAYGKGLPPHRQQPSSSYDFLFGSTLRAHEYRILGKKGEGTFSEVLKCQHIKDGTYYACKKMKQHYNGVEEVNNLREIQAMRRLNPHANVIELHEIIFDKKTGTVALICELMDMNIYELIRGRRHYLQESKVKNYMYQLLKSLDHMHRCGIFHRDVKPENILIKDELLKLADFGSCRSVYSKQPYTEYISTRWYRAPECLLTDGYYTYRMDLWSVGCVFFEVMSLHPLFPGANEVDQIAKIHDVLGTPDPSVLNKMKHRNRGINFDFPHKKGTGIEKLLPHASQQCIELIYKMCTYDPDERITAKQSLRHPYFRDLREADKRAHEAQQTARFNEVSASKTGPASNAGDVPVWKQNQVQKKRHRGKSNVQESKGNQRLSKQDISLNAVKEAVRMTKMKKFEKTKLRTSVSKKEFYDPAKGKVSLLDLSDSAIGVTTVLSDTIHHKFFGKEQVCSPRSFLKPAVLKGKPKCKESLPVGLCASSISNKLVEPKPVLRMSPRSKVVIRNRKTTTPIRVHFNLKKTDNESVMERRQRRLVEQHGHHHSIVGGVGTHTGPGSLPQLVPVNGTAIHGPSAFATASSKPPFPSTTLPKVPLSLHHHGHQQGASLLPGILKPNLMSTKHLAKAKIKPTDVHTKSMYGHYQLPSINRHLYHH